MPRCRSVIGECIGDLPPIDMGRRVGASHAQLQRITFYLHHKSINRAYGLSGMLALAGGNLGTCGIVLSIGGFTLSIAGSS